MNYSIPHYRAEEYTEEIKKVLGENYLYDPMPIHKALLRSAKECVYVISLVQGTYGGGNLRFPSEPSLTRAGGCRGAAAPCYGSPATPPFPKE